MCDDRYSDNRDARSPRAIAAAALRRGSLSFGKGSDLSFSLSADDVARIDRAREQVLARVQKTEKEG